jgi:hypothetical protein
MSEEMIEKREDDIVSKEREVERIVRMNEHQDCLLQE